jgi:hypothetical protein
VPRFSFFTFGDIFVCSGGLNELVSGPVMNFPGGVPPGPSAGSDLLDDVQAPQTSSKAGGH